MIAKLIAAGVGAIKFVAVLLFLWGFIKWAQANPAQWQALVNNVVNAAAAVLNAIMNAIVSALPKGSAG